MIVHAGALESGDPLRQDVGRHGDDRDGAAGPFQRADMMGGRQTIHAGHLHVHENDVEAAASDPLDGFETVRGHVDAMATGFEDQTREIPVHDHVLDEEDTGRPRSPRRRLAPGRPVPRPPPKPATRA